MNEYKQQDITIKKNYSRISIDGNKNNIWMVVSLLLAVATIRLVIKKSGNISINVLYNTILSANKGWLILSVLASALYVGMEGLALRLLLRSAGYNRGRMKSLIYSTSDIYFSAITPSASGGQPASAYFMIRDGVPGGVAGACLVVNLIMYTLAIIVLGIIALFTGSSSVKSFGSSSKIVIYLGFVALTLLAAFFVSLMLTGSKMFDLINKIVVRLGEKGIVKRKNRIIELLEKAKNDYKACTEMISQNHKIMVGVFFSNLLQRA